MNHFQSEMAEIKSNMTAIMSMLQSLTNAPTLPGQHETQTTTTPTRAESAQPTRAGEHQPRRRTGSTHECQGNSDTPIFANQAQTQHHDTGSSAEAPSHVHQVFGTFEVSISCYFMGIMAVVRFIIVTLQKKQDMRTSGKKAVPFPSFWCAKTYSSCSSTFFSVWLLAHCNSIFQNTISEHLTTSQTVLSTQPEGVVDASQATLSVLGTHSGPKHTTSPTF